MFGERSYEKELIDLGSYSSQEYEDCIVKLDQIGRFLGGNSATLSAFDKLSTTPQSILDVGCGGGHFTKCLAEKYPNADVVGIDISEDAINLAKKQTLANLKFIVTDMPTQSFDVVTSTLVCHHLTDDELIHFFQKSYKIARQAVIMNDLHRHFLAYGSFAIIAPLFFRNRLIMHDGLLSIRRAFIRQDWLRLLTLAGIPLEKCSITWHWAFRWVLRIEKP